MQEAKGWSLSLTPPDDRKMLSPILVCIGRRLAVADRIAGSPVGKIRPIAKI
jgi:hypothetical protein